MDRVPTTRVPPQNGGKMGLTDEGVLRLFFVFFFLGGVLFCRFNFLFLNVDIWL